MTWTIAMRSYELRRVAPSNATAGELRSFLAKFLFTGDDVYNMFATCQVARREGGLPS